MSEKPSTRRQRIAVVCAAALLGVAVPALAYAPSYAILIKGVHAAQPLAVPMQTALPHAVNSPTLVAWKPLEVPPAGDSVPVPRAGSRTTILTSSSNNTGNGESIGIGGPGSLPSVHGSPDNPAQLPDSPNGPLLTAMVGPTLSGLSDSFAGYGTGGGHGSASPSGSPADATDGHAGSKLDSPSADSGTTHDPAAHAPIPPAPAGTPGASAGETPSNPSAPGLGYTPPLTVTPILADFAPSPMDPPIGMPLVETVSGDPPVAVPEPQDTLGLFVGGLLLMGAALYARRRFPRRK